MPNPTERGTDTLTLMIVPGQSGSIRRFNVPRLWLRRATLGGVAFAQRVIIPLSSGSLPLSSIPHAPLHWSDAVLFIVIAGALLIVALSVQARRRE